MGRGLAARPRSCDVHPHRPAVDRCDACLGHFCAECFVRAEDMGETLLCRACHAAAPARAAEEAERRRLSRRVREWVRERRSGIAIGGAGAALFGGALMLSAVASGSGGGSTAISRALADEPAVLQRAIAARFCAGADGVSGSVPGAAPPVRPAPPTTGAGTPTVAITSAPPPVANRSPVFQAPTGALVVGIAGVLPDTLIRDDRLASTPLANSPHDPMNLVPYRGGYLPGWRSQTALWPQQIGYELRGQAPVDRVAIQHAGTLPVESWAKDVALLLSTEAADSGFYQVGRWTLAETLEPQEFAFWSTPARYVRLCIHANHGDTQFASLGAFALGVTPPPEQLDTQSRPLLPSRR